MNKTVLGLKIHPRTMLDIYKAERANLDFELLYATILFDSIKHNFNAGTREGKKALKEYRPKKLMEALNESDFYEAVLNVFETEGKKRENYPVILWKLNEITAEEMAEKITTAKKKEKALLGMT